MKTFINRLRWLTAGIYLGMALFAWLAQDNGKKKNITWDLIPSSPGTEAYEPNRKIDIDTDMPGQWSSYKHSKE
jgi:hypothetical protein